MPRDTHELHERLDRLESRLDSLDSDVRDLLGGDRQSVVEVVELLAKRRSLRAPREPAAAASSWGRTVVAVGVPLIVAAVLGATLGLLRLCGAPVQAAAPAIAPGAEVPGGP